MPQKNAGRTYDGTFKVFGKIQKKAGKDWAIVRISRALVVFHMHEKVMRVFLVRNPPIPARLLAILHDSKYSVACNRVIVAIKMVEFCTVDFRQFADADQRKRRVPGSAFDSVVRIEEHA